MKLDYITIRLWSPKGREVGDEDIATCNHRGISRVKWELNHHNVSRSDDFYGANLL